MGLIDMLFPQAGPPSQNGAVQQQRPRGLLDMIGVDPNSTMFNVGAQLLANGLPTTQPFQMGKGIPEAIQNAQTMQLRQQTAEQEEADRAEADAVRAERARYAATAVDPDLKSLAQADPELALQIQESRKPAAPNYTADQQNWLFAQANPEFAAAMGIGQPKLPEQVVEAQTREALAAQYGLEGDAARSFILTGDLPKAGGGPPMSPTIQKELFETEDAINAGGTILSTLDRALELNDAAYDGPGADVRGGAGGWLNVPGAQETQLLDNLSKELALNQLKSIFGAAPTEGERKILLDLQGSVNQPKAVREQIYVRARQAAERRLGQAQQKANALRTGEYFSAGYGEAAPAAAAAPEGVDPADWNVMTPEERALWQQ